MGWVRLLIAGVASIAVICVSLVAAHRLWRRTYSDRPEGHARVVLFNLTTTITVGIGVLTLYLALFVLNLASALVLITTGVLERQIGHPAGVGTYLALAWLVTSLATLGGALGAALENDRAVREAAYGYRPDARNEALREQAESPDRGPPGLENAAS
jgi:putative flippase GtrA